MQGVYQVKESDRLFLFHRHKHDVIYCNEIALEYSAVSTHCRGCHILHSQYVYETIHCQELRPVTPHYGISDESGSHESLAGAGRAHKDEIVHLVKPNELPQLFQLRLCDARAVIEVEAVQIAVARQLCLSHSAHEVVLLTRGGFCLEYVHNEVHV